MFTRLTTLAGGLALSAVLLVPSAVTALPAGPFSLQGNMLAAQVKGSPRVGVWRVRIVAPSAQRRVDFVLRRGDLAWNGVVRISQRVEGRWALVGRRVLRGTHDGLAPARGSAAGVRWSTANFELPYDGNGRFTVRATLTRKGAYRVVSSVRSAVEAFTYGAWQPVARSTFVH